MSVFSALPAMAKWTTGKINNKIMCMTFYTEMQHWQVCSLQQHYSPTTSHSKISAKSQTFIHSFIRNLCCVIHIHKFRVVIRRHEVNSGFTAYQKPFYTCVSESCSRAGLKPLSNINRTSLID